MDTRRRLLMLAVLVISGACAANRGVKTRPADEAGPGAARDPTLQFDAKGADFNPWVRGTTARLRSNWHIPIAHMADKDHVVVTFSVRKDGAVTNAVVLRPSAVASFNASAYHAVASSSPLAPMPSAYPDESAVVTVTFYFNESPP